VKTPRPDFLTAFERSAIEDDLEGLVGDAQVGVTITYKSFVSQTVDVEAGTTIRTEADDMVSASKHIVTVTEVERSGGRLQMGDRIYTVVASALTNVPKTIDRVTDGGVTREVVSWETGGLGLTYEIVVRGGDAQ